MASVGVRDMVMAYDKGLLMVMVGTAWWATVGLCHF